MREWLAWVAEYAVMAIHAMALLIVLVGTVQAFARTCPAIVSPSTSGRHFRTAYLQYARWLIAALTFQLAADIIETSIAPSWYEIGRLAAIAVIRTFLNYFLERDMIEFEEREARHREGAAAKPS
jgi:uncharacterized membrane protein